jgi:hypothetical protein
MSGSSITPQSEDARLRIGDIASMLKTGDLGGKCADLNAL